MSLSDGDLRAITRAVRDGVHGTPAQQVLRVLAWVVVVIGAAVVWGLWHNIGR